MGWKGVRDGDECRGMASPVVWRPATQVRVAACALSLRASAVRTGAADDRRQAVYQLLAATARLERALKAVAQRQLGATQRRWRAGISRV